MSKWINNSALGFAGVRGVNKACVRLIVFNVSTMMRTSSPHHGAQMRTTIDLPEDLHTIVGHLAHSQRTSMSAVVADLMRRALEAHPDEQPIGKIVYHPVTGLPTIRLGYGPITMEMVREMRDDE